MARQTPQDPKPVDNRHSDPSKAHTPDTLRNDKARWKDHDQPEAPRDGRPDPDRDYPHADVGTPKPD